MGKKRKSFLIVAIFCCLLSGCGRIRTNEPVQLNLVQQIDVSYYKNGIHLQRHYTDIDKIDTILLYLYSLSPSGHPEENPERIRNDSCKITVTLTNGETHVYRQYGGRYLSVDCQPWQKIKTSKTAALFPLLARMCSDEI